MEIFTMDEKRIINVLKDFFVMQLEGLLYYENDVVKYHTVRPKIYKHNQDEIHRAVDDIKNNKTSSNGIASFFIII